MEKKEHRAEDYFYPMDFSDINRINSETVDNSSENAKEISTTLQPSLIKDNFLPLPEPVHPKHVNSATNHSTKEINGNENQVTTIKLPPPANIPKLTYDDIEPNAIIIQVNVDIHLPVRSKPYKFNPTILDECK